MEGSRAIYSRTVLLLGLVSLCTDLASEMLYPVLPLYLEQIGFSVAGIGLLEGLAQGAAGLSKGWFGHWSDRLGRRLPFVRWGYGLSAVSKPLMALWSAPLWVLAMRTLDRLGKGIRTGARDALLAAEATQATRGRVFGLHRGMDTLGAALGPLLAMAWLARHPADYRTLFLWALLPGLVAVALTFLLREPATAAGNAAARPHPLAFLGYWRRAPAAWRRLVAPLLAFALLNSSDFFLLLWLRTAGLSDTWLIGLYVWYNLVYALAAWPAGALADRFGMKRTFTGGMLLFAAVYGGMAFAKNWMWFAALFALYGLYAAATEGVAKAWISNLVPRQERATALGTWEALRSVAVLLASALAGIVWDAFGPVWLLLGSAAGVLLVAAWLAGVGVSDS